MTYEVVRDDKSKDVDTEDNSGFFVWVRLDDAAVGCGRDSKETQI